MTLFKTKVVSVLLGLLQLGLGCITQGLGLLLGNRRVPIKQVEVIDIDHSESVAEVAIGRI